MNPNNNNPLFPSAKESGMQVPEGYFEAFEQKMHATLGELPAPEKALPLSGWQRMRPYLYMAAMFIGITLMLRIINDFKGIRNSPEIAWVPEEEEPLFEYILYTSAGSQATLFEEITNTESSEFPE